MEKSRNLKSDQARGIIKVGVPQLPHYPIGVKQNQPENIYGTIHKLATDVVFITGRAFTRLHQSCIVSPNDAISLVCLHQYGAVPKV